MSETHPLRHLLDRLEAELAAAGDQPATGMSGLADGDLEDITTRTWQLMQQLQGRVLVPTVAEADQRRLHKTARYESASSMRDLISGWLHCDPPVAGRLLKIGKHRVNGPFTATAATLATGEIDLDHATKVVSAVRRLPPVIDRDQRHEAETSMLTVATTTTPEVTNKAGYRLMELIAPHEAADYLDRKAERERLRAEEARWLEVASTPIAGCKELRLRLETSTMNTLTRLVESLTQPCPSDPSAQAEAESPALRDGNGHGVRQEAGEVELPIGGAPGIQSATAGFLPLERRRADAMAELVHAMAQPHLADELDPIQLRRLADQLEQDTLTPLTAASTDLNSVHDGSSNGHDNEDGDDRNDEDGGEDGGGQILLDTCDLRDQDPVTIPAQRTNPPNTSPGRPPTGPSSGQPTTAQGTSQATSPRPAGFRGERASLIVITNDDHALRQYRAGEATRPGTPTTATLSPTDVQILECEATVTPVWMTENQTPVSVASPSRYFRGKQLAALIARDKTCVFPGCGRGLRYAHHIIPVSKGGKTKVDNGVMLCGTHHRLIHAEKGWTVRLAEDRLPEFIPPYHLDPHRTPRRHTRHQLQLPVAA